jgi:hypothetical protein
VIVSRISDGVFLMIMEKEYEGKKRRASIVTMFKID